jgi:hypothetical protein
MTIGMRDGCIKRPGRMSVGTTEELLVPCRGAGSDETRPRLIGVETVRAAGRPTVFSTGSRSSRLMTSACSPKEVNVVQLRRARWDQEVSSMLSAKIVSSNTASSNMASSGVKIWLLLWTPRRRARGEVQTENKALEKIKKAAFSRGLLELFRHPRCPALTVWALSAQGAS